MNLIIPAIWAALITFGILLGVGILPMWMLLAYLALCLVVWFLAPAARVYIRSKR